MVRLVDRSLVQYEPDDGRYRLLETLRQYGADRLAEAGETDGTSERHARFFLGLVDRLAPELLDARYRAAHAMLSVELDNLRAAAEWCADHERWVELVGMARQSLLFLLAEPMDGVAWYQQAIDHGDDLDPRTLIDALGELAFLQVAAFSALAAADECAERSLTLAETSQLEPTPWAWLARSTIAANLVGADDGADGLRPAELALAAADARHDEPAASYTFNLRVMLLSGTDPDEGAASVGEALDWAYRTGNPQLIALAVMSAAACRLSMAAEPDFAAGLDILTHYDDGIRVGDLNEIWLDIMWGTALLGLGQPGAVEHLTSAARLADRHGNLRAVDLAVRLLSIAYAESGHTRKAATLNGYATAHLRQHRLDNPAYEWIQARLEAALAGLPERSFHETEGSTCHRGQIMALINNPPANQTEHHP